jgi:hypothetical protein
VVRNYSGEKLHFGGVSSVTRDINDRGEDPGLVASEGLFSASLTASQALDIARARLFQHELLKLIQWQGSAE